MKPEIYVEFNVVFDNDFDVHEITRMTGITPAECRRRSRNKCSPLTEKPIEGFWTLKSNTYMGFEAEEALKEIMEKIIPQISNIIKICKKYKGEVIFCIVASFEKENAPAIYFERPFLDVVNMLSATIQMDMYVE